MTVTTPLTCDGFANALADHLERDDGPRSRAAVEAHAASCADCGALLADLQQLRVDASGLPTLTPSRDLWEGISRRIEAPVIELGRRAEGGGRRDQQARGGSRWMRPVAAAAALVVMTAGVTYLATRQALRSGTQAAAGPVDSATMDVRKMVADAIDSAERAARIGTRIAPTAPDDRSSSRAPRAAQRGPQSDLAPVVPVSHEPALAETLETVYGREIARLRQIVDQRRPTLDTATVSVIERNLTIIDQAIRESRAALARDPASALLNEKLNNALEQKVELLRAAALLPVRS
jgi:hypothetical protein